MRHQVILMRLVEEFAPYLRREPLGLLLARPADISWGPDILVQPDLFVIAQEQAGAREWAEVAPSSPSHAFRSQSRTLPM
jgi:hypothetical protein